MNNHLGWCSSRRKNRDKRLETEASVLPQATVDFYSGQDNSEGCWDEGSGAVPTLEERSFSDSSNSCGSLESMDDYFLDQGGAAAALHAEGIKQEEEERRESEALKDFFERDLDPDSASDNDEDDMCQINFPVVTCGHPAEKKKHSYDDFAFFDWREDKKRKKK